ncbi:MAG: hypothetical protein ACJ8CR_05475 [Roseiflexaceae bacterium]
MRFPSADQLALPCRFERFVPGRLHTDGRRYLPLLVLKLTDAPPAGALSVPLLSVVDRHHIVDPALEGHAGVARLVFLLSNLRLQEPPRQGLEAEEGLAAGRVSTAPVAYGRVVAVPTWEAEQQHLPYESLYIELLLDIGLGIIGVRTNATAASLTERLGKPRIEPGDWVRVWRSRIDILAFEIV